ncbi:MAG TPA: SgcJ/EcaC family oxidoreductase [Gemmatales bacterium]|nr:SgcJ/EcaC family oxidoreductase [Gemmatales bacterium]
MKKTTSSIGLACFGLLAALVALAGYVGVQASGYSPQGNPAPTSQQEKEKEVRSFLETVAATFNKHDAKAVGGLFLAEGELVDEDGNVLKTREAIESHYSEIFKAKPESRLKVEDDTVRLIGDSIAMYDGLAEVKPSAQERVRRTRFAAVLTKQGNQWQIASIRDLEDLDNDSVLIRETMNELGFLVGEWLEEGSNYRIQTDCQWCDDKMSLVQKFKISGSNIKELTGTQRIAWDPATQKIKSWTHDSQGGYAEALWTNKDGGWIVKANGTNSEGDATSMTSEYREASKGRIDLYFRDRIIGAEVMPDVKVTIVRKPPEARP